MQNQVWAKTLLSSYRFLDRVAGAIDKIIEKKALSGGGANAQIGESTLNIAEKIIDLSERKIKLINIKILIENSLKAMDKTEARLLIKKHVEKWPVEEILQEFKLAKRTFFRRIAAAESAFMFECARQGYSAAKLESYLSDENIILEIKKSVEKEDAHKSSSLSS